MSTTPISGFDFVTTARDGNNARTEDTLGRNAFLNLLVTQLQHQDPTQPQADGEFLAQLAQFSQLEQLQQLNQKFDRLMGQSSSDAP